MKKTKLSKIEFSVTDATLCEKAGNLEERNRIAKRLFNRRDCRTVEAAGRSVETWWDKQSRNFITETKDAEGNPIGDATLTGEKLGGAIAHLWALASLLQHAEREAWLDEGARETVYSRAMLQAALDSLAGNLEAAKAFVAF